MCVCGGGGGVQEPWVQSKQTGSVDVRSRQNKSEQTCSGDERGGAGGKRGND